MRASFNYPSVKTLDSFLKGRSIAPFSYSNLHGTKQDKVEGYDNDTYTILLGQGETVWTNAKSALNNWQQFPIPWTKVYKNTTPLKEGNTVVVLFRLFGIWWKNSARIVYDFDEANRYGFAYGTLEGHVETGEECFWIDRDADGNIYYHIKAFSKPAFWGARLTYPMSRIFQRKFGRESMEAMKRLSNSF